MLPASSLFCALLTESSPLPKDSCGSDFEYAPSFLDFINSAQGKPEQQVGDSVIAAQEPDWRSVLKSGMALCNETRDLRVAAILTHAAVELHGLRGFADGLGLILDWLTYHWQSLHPALEIDGEYDPLMRSNALAYLYAPHACFKAVRKTCLLQSRVGDVPISVAEDLLNGISSNDDAVVNTLEQLSQLIRNEQELNQQAFTALREAKQHLLAIQALWQNQLEAEYWPDFDELTNLFKRLDQLLDSSSVQQSMPTDFSQTMSSTSAPAQQVSTTLAWPTSIDNRSEAFKGLVLIRQYFERHEPSHPASLLIQRIEKLQGLDFAQIIAELTPDGIGQLEQISGQSLSV